MPYTRYTFTKTNNASASYLTCSEDSVGYRYGFGGWEKDNEVNGSGHHLSFGNYGYDPRIGRRWRIDPQSHAYPSHSAYSYALDNPIYFIDKDGAYIVDKDGNIVKFKIKKNGIVVFKSPVDAFTKKVILSMSQTEASKQVLLSVRDDKEIKVAYKQSTDKINQHFIEQDNIDLIGVVLPKEEYDLINSYLNGDISKEEYTARKKDLAFRKYSECGNYPKRIFYKDKNVFSEQVVLIDVDEINTMNNPDKEFLLTVTEESAHSLQDFIEIPKGGVATQEQYENLEHEKAVQPLLREVSKQYDEKQKPSGQ